MGKLIEFSATGWSTGKLRCLSCGQDFEATYRTGESVFDCPHCGLPKAVPAQLCQRTGTVWHCRCGNSYFEYDIEDGLYCINCGLKVDPLG